MLYKVFQYDWESVLIQRIVIGFKARKKHETCYHIGNLNWTKTDNIAMNKFCKKAYCLSLCVNKKSSKKNCQNPQNNFKI